MRRRLGAWAENFGIVEPVRDDVARGTRGSGRGEQGGGGERGMEEVQGEELYVMPGWAVVRYREEQVPEGAPAPFDVQLSISGFCSRARPPSKVTRTQRVMLSIVRRFAALPGLNPEEQPMGPIPTAVGMALLEEADEEDRHMRDRHEKEKEQERLATAAQGPGREYQVYQSKRRRPPAIQTSADGSDPASPSAAASASTASGSTPTAQSRRPPPSRASSTFSLSSTSTETSTATGPAFIGHEAIASAHETLQRRIAPFWSSILPNRRVLVDIYASPPPPSSSSSFSSSSSSGVPQHRREKAKVRETDPNPEPADDTDPIASFEIITDSNGHFSKVVTVPWEVLCTTPSTVSMAFDTAPKYGWDVRVRARLDYEVFESDDTGGMGYRERIRRAMATYGVDASDRASPAPSTSRSVSYADSGREDGKQGTTQRESGEGAAARVGLERLSLNTPGEPQVVVNTTVRLGSASGVHVISDLDDTVKHSDILSGPREVFRNVFCRPLEEICVPGMNDMYRRLDEKGVAGFHFVSNSPSQLFPSIRRFLTINEFPDRHSIKLKYYGGRSIFSSLYESPAERKRASLRELFEAFPRAKFVMLGDSAEQDLELYIEFAKLYVGQVALIAIRDVTSDRADSVLAGINTGGTGGSGSSTPTSAYGVGVNGTSTPQPPGAFVSPLTPTTPGSIGTGGLAAGGSNANQGIKAEQGKQDPGSVARVAAVAEAAKQSIPSTSSSSFSAPSGGSGNGSGSTTPTPTSSEIASPSAPVLPPRPPAIRTSTSGSTSSLLSLAEITDDDVRSLSSSQQKILQRAATWQARMEGAYKTKPEGTDVVFFKGVDEVEGLIEAVLERDR